MDLNSLLSNQEYLSAKVLKLSPGVIFIKENDGAEKTKNSEISKNDLALALKTTLSAEELLELKTSKIIRTVKAFSSGEYSLKAEFDEKQDIHIFLAKNSTESLGSQVATAQPVKNEGQEIDRSEVDRLLHAEALVIRETGADSSFFEKIIGGLNIAYEVTENFLSALDVVTYHPYKIVVFILKSNPDVVDLIKQYQSQEMKIRTKQFAILSAPGFKNGDDLGAFKNSVDFVCGTTELGQDVSDLIQASFKRTQK